MNILKMPKDIQLKIKANTAKIKTLNSLELLNYSKALHSMKDIDLDTKAYLFEQINERSKYLNAGHDKKNECRYDKMVKKFGKIKR